MTFEGAVFDPSNPRAELEASAHFNKKRTDSGAQPVQSPFPMTPDDVGRPCAVANSAVEIERDYLAESLREAQGQIEAALSQLSRSQANERIHKTHASGLEARLEDANSRLVDALEQNSFLDQKLQNLSADQMHGTPVNNEPMILAQSEGRPDNKLKEAEAKIKFLEQRLFATQNKSGLSSIFAALNAQVEQFQKAAKEKDSYIEAVEQRNKDLHFHLEHVSQQLRTTVKANEALEGVEEARKGLVEAQKAATARQMHLEQVAAERTEQINKAQAERDQIDGLLQAELRRQAIVINDLEHPNASQLSAISDTESTITEIKTKARKKVAGPVSAATESPEQQIQRLQREVDYHVQDIVLYKLDVRGYKKDIKRANAKIKKLTEAEALKQTLSPTAVAPAVSPSLSFVSAVTSSAPNSAHPLSPSPIPPPIHNTVTVPTIPEPRQVPPQRAPPPLPAANTGAKRPNRDMTPPPPATAQKYAKSTPSTPTRIRARHSQSPIRQRALTGPARAATEPLKQAQAKSMPSSPQRAAHLAPRAAEADSRPVTARHVSEGIRVAQQPVGHIVNQMQKQESRPLWSAEMQKDKRVSEVSRNSLQAFGDVPNGGLPPLQMMFGGGRKVCV